MRRVAYFMILALGILGSLGCLLGLVLVWQSQSTFTQAISAGAEAIDHWLEVGDANVVTLESKLKSARQSTTRLRDLATNSLRDKAAVKLAESEALHDGIDTLEAKLDDLSRVVDSLEHSTESLAKLCELANSWGFSLDPQLAHGLQDRFSALNARLAEAAQLLEMDTNFDDANAPDENRRAALRTAVTKVIASLDGTQRSLGAIDDEIGHLRESIVNAEQKARRGTTIMAVVAVVLILWLLAGQISLALLAWSRIMPRPDDAA